MLKSVFRQSFKQVRRLFSTYGIELTALLTVMVFGGLVLYADRQALVSSLQRVPAQTIWMVIGLTTIGYAIRFAKWEMYLRTLDMNIPVGISLLTFVSGLMMVVTPGKAGELWKAWLLNELERAPISQTASVVGAERITDLIALCGLAGTGVFLFGYSSIALFIIVTFLISVVFLLNQRQICLKILHYFEQFPIIKNQIKGIISFYENTYELFRPFPLLIATGLSLIAWALEGVALWLILLTLAGKTELVVGLFVFGLGSVIGAISFLPGGLGVTEATMVGLLATLGYSSPVATAATIIIRIGTLWYAVTIGAITYLSYKYQAGN